MGHGPEIEAARKPREWWITNQRIIKCQVFDTEEEARRKATSTYWTDEVVHVREVLPGDEAPPDDLAAALVELAGCRPYTSAPSTAFAWSDGVIWAARPSEHTARAFGTIDSEYIKAKRDTAAAAILAACKSVTREEAMEALAEMRVDSSDMARAETLRKYLEAQK